MNIAGAQDMKCSISPSDIDLLKERGSTYQPVVELEFLEKAVRFITERNIGMPNTILDATLLYIDLVHMFENI